MSQIALGGDKSSLPKVLALSKLQQQVGSAPQQVQSPQQMTQSPPQMVQSSVAVAAVPVPALTSSQAPAQAAMAATGTSQLQIIKILKKEKKIDSFNDQISQQNKSNQSTRRASYGTTETQKLMLSEHNFALEQSVQKAAALATSTFVAPKNSLSMTELFERSRIFQPPICSLHETSEEVLTQICLDRSCERFFQPLCTQCLEQHDHSAKLIKGLQSTIKMLVPQLKNVDQLRRDDFVAQNQQHLLRAEFENQSAQFRKLAITCNSIASNIEAKMKEYLGDMLNTSQKQLFQNDSVTVDSQQYQGKSTMHVKLQQQLQKALQANSKDSDKQLREALQEISTIVEIVTLDNKTQQQGNVQNILRLRQGNDSVQIERALQYCKQINELLAQSSAALQDWENISLQRQNMASFIQQMNLSQTLQQSAQFQQGGANALFIKSQFQDSQALLELEGGMVFKGTNSDTKLSQLIYSRSVFRDGIHTLRVKLESIDLEDKNHLHCLAIGLLRNSTNIDQSDHVESNGCHKCLFNAGFQNQMVMEGTDTMPNFSMRAHLKEGDELLATLDLDKNTFIVQPMARNATDNLPPIRYVMRSKKGILQLFKSDGWRFSIEFKNSAHTIRILSVV